MIKNQSFRDNEVCILGLGYVGLTLGIAFADSGFKVHGVEIRDEVINQLKTGKSHFFEPGLNEKITQYSKTGIFSFSKEIPSGWKGTVFIITVGTPLDSSGKLRMDIMRAVTEKVSSCIKEKDIVIMRSTVKVGTTRNFVMKILNKAKVNYDIAFCPERTIEGNAMKELKSLPQIVGGFSESATVRASQIFQFVTPTVVKVSDIETAEIIKLIDNAYRDVRFAYANEVASICSSIGINAAEVINAGKLGYSRTNIPMPGPVGGPCLEKDPYILAEGVKNLGVIPRITLAARTVNESLMTDVAKFIYEQFSHKDSHDIENISFLGIAFKGKPATDDLRGTMAKPFLRALKEKFKLSNFFGYDPMVQSENIEKFGLKPAESIEDAFLDKTILVILNNHVLFETLNLVDLSKLMKRDGIIYDFWNLYEPRFLQLENNVKYIPLGHHKKNIFQGDNSD